MSMRLCPFCKEKIHRAAVVCRFCQRDLPEMQNRCDAGIWIAVLTASAVIISGAAFLALEYLRERRHWIK